MNDLKALRSLIEPLVMQANTDSVLVAGELAESCLQTTKDTRIITLTTPYNIQQLSDLPPVKLALISHLTESLPKQQAQQWLGVIKNLYAPHIIVISHPELASQQGWTLTDYIALGFKHYAGNEAGLQLFSYNIENYQPKRDWLNSRFWANPALFDKYRW